jgi:hypothetical protein
MRKILQTFGASASVVDGYGVEKTRKVCGW